MNEWGFTGEVKSWIDQIVQRNTNLPFSGARVEEVGHGSKKRRDLTLVDRNGVALLTGEVKLPDAPDGASPYRAEVVKDARQKAERAGVKFFFTWNVNECVLWETATAGSGLKDRAYERWTVAQLTRREQLESSTVQAAIHEWLVTFLHDAARILKAGVVTGSRTPDIKFVEALESALTLPIRHTHEALTKLYTSKPTFKRDLDQWMLALGWTIVTDAEGVRELLERAAKFGCYLLVNKLVFHEALLKKYGKTLEPLLAPPEITTGDELQMRLQSFFAEAKEVTGDYETIFGDNPADMGRRIPFYADAAVVGWRSLIDQIHEFDFSKLDYEVVGSIFERLIGPEERHKYGQFYTRVEVVDLINSFCILNGNEKVLDPACGGGTFLVRAYARKRVLAETRKHRELLTDIYGTDVSQFAAHLTTMNLATRDLVEDENYPRIGRSDFFDVLPDSPFIKLPQKLKTQGLGTKYADISIPPLDAVIANPPYVRQEEIAKAKIKSKGGGPEAGTKEFYRQRVALMANAHLSGRSDLHCYFWPHAATFLKQEGMLGFITSSQWLDVEYGFKLQKYLLENFEIMAILESPVEPWFVGARVSTAVTIAKKCSDSGRRKDNTVRFIRLCKPLAELLENDGTTAGAVQAADRFRDEILVLTKNVSNKRYRARLIPQKILWQEGVNLGRMMRGEEAEERGGEEDEAEDTLNGSADDYAGGKWGVYLRAPDFWFDLLDQYGNKFTPLGQLATVRRGITSGKDDFFFPKDISNDCLTRLLDANAFEVEYGIPRKQVADGKVKLVLAGEGKGELHAIEAEYLEPEVHSLMGVERPVVLPDECKNQIFLCPSGKKMGPLARNYIRWAEKKHWHNNATCSARVTETRDWWDLTDHQRAPVLWPKEKQYRHIAPANPKKLIANCRLYEIYPVEADDPLFWGGILNSTVALLSSLQYGRPMGNEGNWSTMVVDVNMMLVPNTLGVGMTAQRKIISAFEKLAKRDSMQFLSERRMREMAFERAGKAAELELLSNVCELDMPDRRELDHAVFELLGIKTKKERDEWIDKLYSYLREFFEGTRRKEELAIVNKNVTKRKGAVSPQDLAVQISHELNTSEPQLFKSYRDFFRDAGIGTNWIAKEVPTEGIPELHVDMLDIGLHFMRGKKQLLFMELPSVPHAELAKISITEMRREMVKLPREERDCKSLLKEYSAFLAKRDTRLRELVGERVADEDVQAKAFEFLLTQIRQGHQPPTV